MGQKERNDDKNLKILRCPFCGGDFGLKKGDMWNGILECGCDEFGMVDGILILKRNTKKELGFWSRNWLGVVVGLQRLLGLNFGISMRLMELGTWGPERLWFKYLANRERRLTFEVLKKLAGLVADGLVLDAAAGGCHLINYLKQQNKEIGVVAVDSNYWLLRLARATGQIDDGVLGVVVDLEGEWPFRSGGFDYVMANDCLHYIDHQKLFVKEAERVVKKEGMVLMGHVHRKGKENVAQGKGVEPEELKVWLGLRKVLILNDGEIFGSKSKKSFSVVAGRGLARMRWDRTVAIGGLDIGEDGEWLE